MKKIIKRIVSALLSFTMTLSVIPITMLVKAEPDNADNIYAPQNESSAYTEYAETTDTDDSASVSYEVVEKRELDTKHFKMSDGSYTAAVYPYDVHYINENGEMTDIDNSLTDDNDGSDNMLSNKSNTANVKFMKKSNKNKLYTINRNGNKIKVSIDGVSSVPVVYENKNTVVKDDSGLALPDIGSKVSYRDILDSTDIEFSLFSTDLKENIIIKNKVDFNSIVYNYHLNGSMEVVVKDDKNIELYDKNGNLVFNVSAPVMWDADGNYSDDLSLELVENKNSKVKIKLSWNIPQDAVYPVTVDPVVQTKPDTSVIQNKYITSYNSNLNAYGSMYVGKESNMGQTRSAVKFTSLPALDKGDMVTNASINLGQMGYDHVSSPELQINAYEITSAWNGFNLSSPGIYSTSDPVHDSRVLDYVITSSSNNYHQIAWDITSTVKKWYNGGENNGIFFAASDTRWAYAHLVSKHTSIQGGKPVMYVRYINNRGLEDYWTFSEHSLGSGTGYINNYTGNLVVNIPICDTGSAGLPAGISYYYNGYQSGMHFAVTQGGGVYESSKSVCGAGWKLNADERLAYLTPGKSNNDELHAQGIKYTYTDADGTLLYMKEKKDAGDNVIPGVFEDELGKGLTLEVQSDGTWKLSDKQNNQKIFTAGGQLWKLQSNQSCDQIIYHYNNENCLVKITDGSGQTINITRNENNAILKITNSLGTTHFGYSGACLAWISYPDGGTMQFGYDSASRLISVTARDGTSVTYTYSATGDTAAKNRVIKVSEYSAPNANGVKTAGNSITFDYNIGNYTKVTDNKGRSVVYSFDNIGRTTSAVDELGAVSATYTNNVSETKASENKHMEQNNKLLAASSGTMPVDNLLKNTSFEQDYANWYKYDSSSAGGSSVYSSDAYIGSKSIKLYANADNINNQIYQTYNPTKTGKYTFSFYFKTDGLTGTGGVEAILGLHKTDGTTRYVSGSCSTQSTEGLWERLSVTENITSDIDAVYAIIILQNASGTVYVDCAQLEYGGSANAYNMVENSFFKYGSSGWVSNSQSTNIYGATHGSVYDSECPEFITHGVFMSGDSSQNKFILQDIQVNQPANKTALQLSGYACAKSVPKIDDRLFALDLCFHYSDGTKEFVIVDFNYSSTTWQYVSKLVMPSKENQSKHVSYVTPYFLYYQNQNTVCFSGMNLTLDKTGTTYQYDEKGNMVSAMDMAERESIPTIDSANRLTVYKDAENAYYKYTYNTDNADAGTTQYQVKSVLHQNYAQLFEFQYDNHGNIIQSSQRNAGGGPLIQTNSTYSANGDRLLSAVDSLRNAVTYNYSTTNPNDLRVQSTTQNGATVNYTYKPNTGLVTGISSEVTGIDGQTQTISNTYNYTNDRLTSIGHNGFEYNFTYDDFGNRLMTKVGSQVLMTDIYGANNGLLTKSTYGNGAYVENIYDRYDRVTGIKYNGIQKFGYEYDANGLISRHTDDENGRIYTYTYDILGRLQRTDVSDGSIIKYNYDRVNNTAGTTYKYAGITKTTKYPTYFLGGAVLDVTYPNGASKTRYLNGHAQVCNSILTTPAGNEWSINRQYYSPDGNGTYTTNVTGSLKYANIDRTFSYTYDGSGNISGITDNTGTTAKNSSFVYDEANQLIRENNAYTNKTVTYAYDAGGNILTKTEYPFTTGSLDGMTGTVVYYTYGNTVWKDLLTAYNGQSITYDAIGNPLTYYNGTEFTWNYGRKLATAETADGTSITYKYDGSGIRTSKTVNGVTTEYFVDGSRIIAEKTNNNTTWYYYDGDGTREAIEYNGNVYYYIYNAQGDVIGLFDNALNVVVSYTYDSWGNIVSITGSMSATLGNDNPFRYRGYYYDSETGLYYLNSRYYDPQTCRFINADVSEALEVNFENFAQYNLFAYCFNNPVNMSDDDGTWPKWAKNLAKVAVGAGAVVIVAAVVAATAATGGAAAAFVGAAVAGVKAAAISGAIGAGVGAGAKVVSNRVSTGSWKGSGKALIGGAVDGFADGFMSGGIMAGGSQVLSGGFKVAANAGVKTGTTGGIKNTGILSPNRLRSTNEIAKIAQKGQSFYDYGGQLFKIGSLKLDIGSKTFLHMHTAYTGSKHLPVSIVCCGLYGGFGQWE